MFHGSLMNVMGTRLDMVLVGKDKFISIKIWDQITSLVEQLHSKFNRFDEHSEVFFVNLHAHNQYVKLSDDLWEVLLGTRKYFEKTNGLFDITLNDFAKIRFHKKKKSISFQSKDTFIDLGGYAKGYAIEKIKKILVNNDVYDAFVDFGNSSVLAMGKHPYGNSWKLTVPSPIDPLITLDEIELSNQSLSTSGNVPNHTRHIKNTRAREYSDERKIVSVIADNAIDAEVISTVLMVTQPNEIDTILKEFHIDKYMIYNYSDEYTEKRKRSRSQLEAIY